MEEHKKLSDIKDAFETAELLLACRAEYQKTINEAERLVSPTNPPLRIR